MKLKYSFVSFLIAGSFIIFQGCLKDPANNKINSGFPTTFKVDIPPSLSQTISRKSASADLSGKEIYQHLNNFIYVGESASDLIQDIMKSISTYGLNKPMEFSYVSDDDGLTKNVIIVSNSEFDGKTWEFQLTITDANSEGNDDGGKALEVFWNESPVKGIAILCPKNWDTTSLLSMKNTLFRVDYSEAGENGYSQEMTVYISQWGQDYADRFHLDNLKMFVGKNGDVVDVFGNSNHPDAWLILEEPVGFDWAFVASANQTKNIGVAEVGLPISTLDETDRKVLLEDNSIKNVLSGQLREYVYNTQGFYPDSTAISLLLTNADAPGFFNNNGFIQGGIAPSGDYNQLVSNIQLLSPHNPLNISQLKVEFK